MHFCPGAVTASRYLGNIFYNCRYGFANVLLILGAVKEIRLMLVVWMVATLATLVWEFVLLSVLFSYDTTIGLSFQLRFL